MVDRQVDKPTCKRKYELVCLHVTQKFHQLCQADILFTNAFLHTHPHRHMRMQLKQRCSDRFTDTLYTEGW